MNKGQNSRFACLISVIRRPRLSWRYGRIVHQLEQVLTEAGDNGHLLAMLADRVELVGEGGLELLARDVAQLSLGHQRLGLSPHQLLLQHDNLRAVGLLVLELRDLIGDFLLSCEGWATLVVSEMFWTGSSKTVGL